LIAAVIALVVGHQLWIRRRTGRVDVFDVKVLIDVVLLVMFVWAPLIDPGLRDASLQDSGFIATTLSGIVALYLGLEIFGNGRWLGRAREAFGLMRRWPLWTGVVAFCAVTVIMVRRYSSMSGLGVSGWFLSDRTALVATVGGTATYQLIEGSRPIVLLLLAYFVVRRRWAVALLLYSLLLVGILMIFQTRLQVIITLMLPLVIYHYRVRRLRAPVVVAGAFSFMVLMLVLNVWRAIGFAAIREVDFSPTLIVKSVAVNFSPIVAYHELWAMHQRHALRYEYGLTYAYVPLVPIPRAAWPSKPLVSFEPRWNVILFGDEIPEMNGERGAVWTFTAWGEGLAQFGPAGVVLNLFLYGAVVGVLRALALRHPLFFIDQFYYGIFAATFLRSSFTALLVTVLIAFVPVSLLYSASRARIIQVRPRRGRSAPAALKA
jgi:hypothetical protein